MPSYGKKLSARTIRRLRDVVARIPARRLQMTAWVGDKRLWADVGDAEVLRTECGTAGCLYGWACAFYPVRDRTELIDQAGDRIFGFDSGQGVLLSSLWQWPEQFRDRYLAAKRPATRLRVLRDRVEHFIATEGRDA